MTNPAAFEDYNKGKGVIATREKFLTWLSEHGKEDLDEEDYTLSTASAREFGKTISHTCGNTQMWYVFLVILKLCP